MRTAVDSPTILKQGCPTCHGRAFHGGVNRERTACNVCHGHGRIVVAAPSAAKHYEGTLSRRPRK